MLTTNSFFAGSQWMLHCWTAELGIFSLRFSKTTETRFQAFAKSWA